MFDFYTFIYSKVFLNLNEFHKRYFEEGGKPKIFRENSKICVALILSVIHFLSTVYNGGGGGGCVNFFYSVNVDQRLFGNPDSSKYLILCSAEEIN